MQTIHSHLKGQGCPKCFIERKTKTTEEFIKEARSIYGDKYDYSKVNYKNATTKVCIICPTHGEFFITPTAHTCKSQECPICTSEKTREKTSLGTEKFIDKARNIHGDKYDYSKVEYKQTHIKVKIICPIHGEFEQEPNSHLRGQGCPLCKESHLERDINSLLTENKISFIRQYSTTFLGVQTLDFYIPKYKIGIECQGSQHITGKWFRDNRQSHSNNTIELDIKKYNRCKENNIKLYYYFNRKCELDKVLNEEKYGGIYNENNSFFDKEIMLEKIMED